MTERTTIDLAHRISKDHAKELGLKFGTETTGFDSRLINQVILRPVERELEILYAKQRKLRTQFQEGKAPENYEKRMNDLNAEINKQIKLTNGRMIGVNIDPNTNEVSFTGQKKKFKLSNLDLTFEQIKDLPKDEKQKIITDSVLKGVEAEKARGFRPYDFRTLLSSPERRKEVLKYAKTNAPDIFSKVKQAISNPESKQRFALYSKLPTALIPVGMTLAFASQSGEARADEPGVEDEDSILPEAAIATAAAAPLATKTGRNIYGTTGKGLLKALRVLGQPSVAAGFAADELRQGNIKTAGASLLAPELVGSLAPAGRGILSTIGRIAANPFGKAARAFTPVGLATIGAGALKDVYDEYQRREALTDEERLAEDIERDRAADEMMIGAAEGGRIGFADGPDDPSKRKFMKLMGIMSLLPFGIGKGIKMATKAAPVVAEGAKLGFDNFLQLMIKIKAFGKEDPTRATLERQKATIYTGKDGSEYELIEDMSTGDIRITRDKPGMASSGDEVFDTIEDRSTFELRVGQADETTKGKKPPDEYDEGKTIFDQDGTPADVDEIDDATIKAIKDEIN